MRKQFTLIEVLGLPAMAPQERRQARERFTLIELLVVVAIIAILAAMLLPVLGRAKETASMAVCMNNQKQMALSNIMYAEDYGDFAPYYYSGMPMTKSRKNKRNRFNGTTMFAYMLPMLYRDGYLGDMQVGYCSKVGPPDENGLTNQANWPGGMKFRMDHDYGYWGDPYENALTNQGDFAYYGPGTSHYDWEHWSNKTSTQLWVFMQKAVPSLYPGHVGAVHADGRVTKGHCQDSERSDRFPYDGPTVQTTVARMPLMMDSFLAKGGNWWGSSPHFLPHFWNTPYRGRGNVLFHDGSVET